MLAAPFIKSFAKYIQAILPFAISKNEKYDRLSRSVIQRHCKPDSICIDIGANKGKILQWMIQAAPMVKHFAFEPIPTLYQQLVQQYSTNAHIYPIALSNVTANRQYNFVETNPALSGFLKRPYPAHFKEKQIEVTSNLLDHLIDQNLQISLIKIDVEGGEWDVLRGAIQTINRSKPLIIFECGKTGGNLYQFSSTDIYHFFEQEVNYQIFTLSAWLKGFKALSYQEFHHFYETEAEYFFLAAPIDITI